MKLTLLALPALALAVVLLASEGVSSLVPSAESPARPPEVRARAHYPAGSGRATFDVAVDGVVPKRQKARIQVWAGTEFLPAAEDTSLVDVTVSSLPWRMVPTRRVLTSESYKKGSTTEYVGSSGVRVG